MPVIHAGPKRAEPLRDFALLDVGTAHAVAKVKQQLGYAAHADTADADKMNVMVLFIHASTVPFRA